MLVDLIASYMPDTSCPVICAQESMICGKHCSITCSKDLISSALFANKDVWQAIAEGAPFLRILNRLYGCQSLPALRTAEYWEKADVLQRPMTLYEKARRHSCAAESSYWSG